MTATTCMEAFELDNTGSASPEAFEAGDQSESPKLPLLFWAGLILFAANLLILFGIIASPELKVGMYGETKATARTVYRPSAFTERVEVALQHLKPPMKVRPVVYQEPVSDSAYAQPTAGTSQVSQQQLNVPRATPASLTVFSQDQSLTIRRTSQNEQPRTGEQPRLLIN